MKRTIITVSLKAITIQLRHMAWLFASLLLLSSCNDYLSTIPKGKKIPTTLADFEAMIRDEYTCMRVDVLQALILMNDRHVTESNLSYYPLYGANYNWNEEVNRIDLNRADESTYYMAYASISTCNLLIENAMQTTEATEKEQRELMAQAKVLRAMSYFTLVNFYADTYQAATASQKGGVPLITSSNVNAAYSQPSVQAIYDFMLNDMEEAYNDLPANSATILHPNKATADAFYARIYLQMNNYEQALIYAERALSANDKLFNWVAYYEEYKETIENPDIYTPRLPTPMNYSYVENYNYRHGSISSYASSENNLTVERATRFEEGDAKMAARWKYRLVGVTETYTSCMTGYYNYGGMTTTEVYLIKAECLARKGSYQEAMNVVNKVRETRILPTHYQPLVANNEAEAMAYIARTKGNELILTHVPFMDARRWNAEGKYPVTIKKTVEGKEITLSSTSHLWTMPFPQGAIQNAGNGSIQQNVSK